MITVCVSVCDHSVYIYHSVFIYPHINPLVACLTSSGSLAPPLGSYEADGTNRAVTPEWGS